MLLRKCGKKNLENYQLPKWSLPKDYFRFWLCFRKHIHFVFNLYFVALPLPRPHTPQCENLVSSASYQGSTRAEPMKTKVAFIIELDTRFVIAADLHISLKLYFYEKPTLPTCKNYHSFLPMWLLGILYVLLWTNVSGKELKKNNNKYHSISADNFVCLRLQSCDTGSEEVN